MIGNDLQLALKVKADVKQAKAELAQLTKEIEKQKAAAAKAAAENAKAGHSLRDMAKHAKSNENAIGNQISLYRGAASALGLYAVIAKTFQAIRIADEFKQIEARVARATRAQGDYNAVWRELIDISNENGQAVATTVSLFEGINRSAPEIRATRDQVLAVSRAVTQLGVLSGAAGEQMRNSMLQFSQAMAGGIVRAEEMNSIIENTPAIAEAIAKGMGLTVGQLRKAVAEGKILSSKVFASLLKQAPEIAREFKDAPITIERAGQAFANNTQRLIAEVDKRIGLTHALGGLVGDLSAAVGTVADDLASINDSANALTRAEEEMAAAMNESLRIIAKIDRLREKQAKQGSLAEVERRQLENLEYLLARVDQRARTIAARIAELRKSATELNGEAEGAGGNRGSRNSMAAAIASHTKENDQLKGLVDQRNSLIDQLDALKKKLSGKTDPENASASSNVFTLNRLRGSAESKFEKGDITGGLEDLERAKSIVEQLAQSSEVSKGYLQTQIDLVRELADELKNDNRELEVQVRPVVLDDAHVIAHEFGKLREQFEKQNPGFKIKPEVDGQGAAEALKGHLNNLQAITSAQPIVAEIVFRQSGLGEPINISIGGNTIKARADEPIVEAVKRALREEEAARGGD